MNLYLKQYKYIPFDFCFIHMMDVNTSYMHILKAIFMRKYNNKYKLGKVTKNCKQRANSTSMMNVKA